MYLSYCKDKSIVAISTRIRHQDLSCHLGKQNKSSSFEMQAGKPPEQQGEIQPWLGPVSLEGDSDDLGSWKQ